MGILENVFIILELKNPFLATKKNDRFEYRKWLKISHKPQYKQDKQDKPSNTQRVNISIT